MFKNSYQKQPKSNNITLGLQPGHGVPITYQWSICLGFNRNVMAVKQRFISCIIASSQPLPGGVLA